MDLRCCLCCCSARGYCVHMSWSVTFTHRGNSFITVCLSLSLTNTHTLFFLYIRRKEKGLFYSLRSEAEYFFYIGSILKKQPVNWVCFFVLFYGWLKCLFDKWIKVRYIIKCISYFHIQRQIIYHSLSLTFSLLSGEKRRKKGHLIFLRSEEKHFLEFSKS